MTNYKFFNATKRTLLTITAILTIFAGLTLADDITLDMEGTTATIPKGNTITRKIFGIPKFGGVLKMKYKWHAVSLIPNTFNALKVVIKHGSTVINSKSSCYSTHSTKTPKCEISTPIDQTEAHLSGSWTIEVTNNSADEVISFDIRKGSDINPAVSSFNSFYEPFCPDTVNLDLEGADTTTITKGGATIRKIFGVAKLDGVLKLKAKWHAVHIIPNTFNALKIELLKPDGTVAQSGNYYSFHSNKTPKFDITYNMTQEDAEKPGNWSLRITNNSAYEAIGFNIVKGNDINPVVPSFKSTYKANCP